MFFRYFTEREREREREREEREREREREREKEVCVWGGGGGGGQIHGSTPCRPPLTPRNPMQNNRQSHCVQASIILVQIRIPLHGMRVLMGYND